MTTNATTADGVFKRVFGDALENTVPDFAILSERIGFKSRAKLGKEYQFPVRVKRSHGVTFKAGDDQYDAFTLNAVRTGQTLPATVSGGACVIRESIGHMATLAAIKQGDQAFVDLYGEAVADVYNSLGFYLEASLLYGQSATGFGEFAAGGANSAAQSIALTAATSAPGLWAQMEGAACDVWNAAYAAKVNSNADVIIAGSTYDASTGQVTLALTGNATDLDAIIATDIIVPKGAYDATLLHQMFAGIDKIVTNTGSLFGISATTYPSWGANSFSCASARLTFQKMLQGQVLIANRYGLTKKPLVCAMSAMTWTNIAENMAALRREVTNKGTFELGSETIKFYGVTGSIELVPHPMVKGGEAFMGMLDEVTRGGITQTTFKRAPTVDGGEATFLRELVDSNGLEFRGMWDNFIIIRKPRSFCKFTTIVNGVS